jgi:hypothetical protein
VVDGGNMKKGIVGIFTIAIIGAIAMGTTTAILLMPAFFLRIHLLLMVNHVYNYNNAQLAMLTFLSTTYQGESISNILAEHIVLSQPPSVDFLHSKLGNLTCVEWQNNVCTKACYRLSYSEGVLLRSEACELRYKANATLALPYGTGQLTERLMLEIG